MSITPRLPIPSFIPENAPFSPEQRMWLNGLFAGLISPDEGVTPLSTERAAALLPDLHGTAKDEQSDDAPWRDPTLPLAERMKLAEGKPLRGRLMAAMAQQDCGQCGYNCHDYSEAIFSGREERLNLCVPGGKETARMLKLLYQELGVAAEPLPVVVEPKPQPAAKTSDTSSIGFSRNKPVEAKFLSRERLSKPGSAKDTWHIEIDIAESGIDYAVGDSLGIFPVNDPALVD